MRPEAPVVCIVGPTASGKSAAALALARALPGAIEIVSVDSAQVYRGLDIGSAKPGPAERAEVPHHGIDLVDPAERYSAARFAADARAAIAGIRARGRVPLLVGGTGLYLRALFEGLAPMPEADPATRAAIDAEARARGWPALHGELARVDPRTAARLAPNDAQRIQRALEVWRTSGRPISQWHDDARDAAPADGGALGAPRCVALEPRDRAWLHARIDARFAQMLRGGLLDEVRALRARGDLDPSLPALRSVGYRQAWAALDGGQPVDRAALHASGAAATRRLAKRQLTWLRAMPGRHVVAADDPDAIEQTIATALRWLDEAAAR